MSPNPSLNSQEDTYKQNSEGFHDSEPPTGTHRNIDRKNSSSSTGDRDNLYKRFATFTSVGGAAAVITEYGPGPGPSDVYGLAKEFLSDPESMTEAGEITFEVIKSLL